MKENEKGKILSYRAKVNASAETANKASELVYQNCADCIFSKSLNKMGDVYRCRAMTPEEVLLEFNTPGAGRSCNLAAVDDELVPGNVITGRVMMGVGFIPNSARKSVSKEEHVKSVWRVSRLRHPKY